MANISSDMRIMRVYICALQNYSPFAVPAGNAASKSWCDNHPSLLWIETHCLHTDSMAATPTHPARKIHAHVHIGQLKCVCLCVSVFIGRTMKVKTLMRLQHWKVKYENIHTPKKGICNHNWEQETSNLPSLCRFHLHVFVHSIICMLRFMCGHVCVRVCACVCLWVLILCEDGGYAFFDEGSWARADGKMEKSTWQSSHLLRAVKHGILGLLLPPRLPK